MKAGSDCADVQADLGLCFLHVPKDMFLYDAVQIDNDFGLQINLFYKKNIFSFLLPRLDWHSGKVNLS